VVAVWDANSCKCGVGTAGVVDGYLYVLWVSAISSARLPAMVAGAEFSHADPC
jgi:hypothetical protein